MTVVNLEILLSDVTRVGNRSVRHFDADRGVYLGKMCLNTEVQPPQIEVKLELPDLGTEVFQFHDGSVAIDHLIEDHLAMGLINKAIDQAVAPDFERFVRDELPEGYRFLLDPNDDLAETPGG